MQLKNILSARALSLVLKIFLYRREHTDILCGRNFHAAAVSSGCFR